MPHKTDFVKDFVKDKMPFMTSPDEPLADDINISIKSIPTFGLDSPSFRKGFSLFLAIMLLFIVGVVAIFIPSFKEVVPQEMNNPDMLVSSFIYPIRMFGFIIVIFAVLGFLFLLFAQSLRKTFVIGNRYVTVNVANLFAKKTFMEAIANYSCIRYRVLLKANDKFRYIIDMKHKDSMKNIPLYVSDDGDEVYAKAVEYAEHFNLPIVFMNKKDELLKESDKVIKEESKISLSSKLPFFPKKMFLGLLLFFVLLDVAISVSPLARMISFYGFALITVLSGLLVFLLPFSFCFRKQEVNFLKSELNISKFVFNQFALCEDKIKYKDIVSVHVIKQNDKNMLFINTQNGSKLLGYGAKEASLFTLKKQIEMRISKK